MSERGLQHNLFHKCASQRNSHRGRAMRDGQQRQRARLCLGIFHLNHDNALSWVPGDDPPILADPVRRASAPGGGHGRPPADRALAKRLRISADRRPRAITPAPPEKTVAESTNGREATANERMRRSFAWPVAPALAGRPAARLVPGCLPSSAVRWYAFPPAADKAQALPAPWARAMAKALATPSVAGMAGTHCRKQ